MSGAERGSALKTEELDRAAALLRDGHMLVYEAAERLGYQNYRSFSAAFEKYYHCNPKKFKG